MSKKTKHAEKFDPFNIIVFGGDGDLALRKIYPALFHRFLDGQFDSLFNIVAITRKEPESLEFYEQLERFVANSISGVEKHAAEIRQFMDKVRLVKIKEHSEKGYSDLSSFLNQFPGYQNIYYFSTPSSAFGEIARTLKTVNLIDAKSKVVLEKPLGFSLESSNAINASISLAFQENQIYRIDHYLGKETVQNLMVLRFTNNLFEKAWNGENIDNVQITVSENLGVENRGSYYDNSGALLDMVQNHLLQLLCLVAMEPPYILDADQVRNEKLKVLHSLRFFTKKRYLPTPSKDNIPAAASTAKKSAPISKTSGSTLPKRKLLWPSKPLSTTGAGKMFLFTSGRASA